MKIDLLITVKNMIHYNQVIYFIDKKRFLVRSLALSSPVGTCVKSWDLLVKAAFMRGVKAAQEGGKVGRRGKERKSRGLLTGALSQVCRCQAVFWDSGEPWKVNEKQNCHFGDQCQKAGSWSSFRY